MCLFVYMSSLFTPYKYKCHVHEWINTKLQSKYMRLNLTHYCNKKKPAVASAVVKALIYFRRMMFQRHTHTNTARKRYFMICELWAVCVRCDESEKWVWNAIKQNCVVYSAVFINHSIYYELINFYAIKDGLEEWRAICPSCVSAYTTLYRLTRYKIVDTLKLVCVTK